MTPKKFAENVANYDAKTLRRIMTDVWLENDLDIAGETASKNLTKYILEKPLKSSDIRKDPRKAYPEVYKKYYKQALVDIWQWMHPHKAKEGFIMETFESDE